MKNSKQIRFIVSTSVLTAVTLSGGLFFVFYTLNVVVGKVPHEIWRAFSGISVLLIGLVGCGALWGLGLALLTGKDLPRITLAGAKYWGFGVFIAALALEAVNWQHGKISLLLNIPRHAVLTTSLSISIFILVMFTVHGMVKVLGKETHAVRAGWYCAAAAAVAYLLVDLVMVSRGWVLGRPQINGRSVMLTVMLAGNLGAALAGGAVLGWILYRESY